jgi:hypothetical protein
MTTDYSRHALIEALDGIHEWSMSREEHVAVTGRCLKLFYEQFDEFDKAECARGVHRGLVIYGIIHAMGVIAAVTALSGCKDGYQDGAVTTTVDLFSEVVKSVADAQAKERMAGKNT